MKIDNLLKYYIECIEIESLEEMSFPSFKMDEAFIRFPQSNEWSAQENSVLELNAPQRMRNTLALGGGTSALYYGWPIYARPAVTKNGNPYCWIEPVFILKVEFHPDGHSYELTLLREWPKVNDRILKRFAQTIEERIQLVESLGLSSAENLVAGGLISHWNRLVELFPNLQLAESIQVTNLSSADLSGLQQEGFYNQALLLTSSAPRYSRGLLRELRSLSEPANLTNIANTSLQRLVGLESKDRTAPQKQYDVLQITPLNRSQRQATTRALDNRLSVITGPPGTGKSQVVLNILANAFEKNQTVLFTSKNNKAVDVVCERVFDLLNFPINLRLGAKTADRDYTTEFLDLLDKVLSGGDKDAIVTSYNRAKQQFDQTRTKYFAAVKTLDEIVSVRNNIDELDKASEHYEKTLDPSILERAKKIQSRKSDALTEAEYEFKKLQSGKVPFSYRFVGLFSKVFPFKRLHHLCEEIRSLIDGMLALPQEIEPRLDVYSHFLANARPICEFIELQGKLSKLRKQLSAFDINKTSESIDKLEKEFVEKCRTYIECLGRHRMINLTAEQRTDLTNYYAVVRQLSGEYPGATSYAKLKQQQERLFKRISKVLPVWSVTNLSAGGHFPFSPSVFDLVIIDEASQSDIASAIPLLYRAKQAIIIGDPQQLKHISSIARSQDNQLLERYGLLGEDNLRFSYSTQSLYHCSRGAVDQDTVTLLNEHYRSHFSIIEFSNREWYDGNLEIRTNYDNLFFPPDGREHIEWLNIVGQTERPGNTSALNVPEANKVLDVLDELFNLYKDEKPTMGIVTPFAAQKQYIIEALSKKYDEQLIRSHFLLANTAHQFQGDERDMVIFSPVISRGAATTTIGFLRSTSNLFNVSITRARSILWVVGDRQACVSAGIPYLKNFVEYIFNKRYKNIDLPRSEFESPNEKRLYEVLKSMGYEPKAQHPVGPYWVDIALQADGKKLAIEVDGERWHTTLTGERLERDIVRDRNLRIMGWDVLRFWVHELKYDLDNCIKSIESRLKP